MDRNALLIATRAEFLQAYLAAYDICRPHCVDEAFRQADASRSSLEQHHLLIARGILLERHAILREYLQVAMAQLLNRSLQTTYSNDRPVFRKATASLSLVDTVVFEDELQLGAFTDHFRREADEQLRDLNIRIAVLFGQDDIKERENPFRPYLISRALADASADMALPIEIGHRLTMLMADGMSTQVDGIYASVNAFLVKHGVAAELPLKIRKSPNPTPAVPLSEDADFSSGQLNQGDIAAPPSSSAGGVNNGAHGAAQTIDQFLQNIQSMVVNAGNQAVGSLADVFEQHALPRSSTGVPPLSTAAHAVTQSVQNEKIDKLLTMMQQYSQQAGGAVSTQTTAVMSTPQPPLMMTRLLDNLRSLAAMGVSNMSAPSVQAAAANSEPGVVDHASWMGGVQKMGTALRQFFAPGTSTPGAAGSGGMRQVTVQLAESVDSLLETQTPSTADIINSEGRIRNVLLERRASLTEKTSVIDEQMTIDVVAMLFEFILQDHRVPAEVRAQLGRLQFLVLKMALRDPTLLTKKGHPVRLLINRIGTISVGLKKIDPGSERVSHEICRIVESLLHSATNNPTDFATHFSLMLDDFDAFVATELRHNDEQINQALGEITQIKHRTLRFAHISAQMAEILSSVKLDAYLHDFLSITWVQVIERAETIDMARAKRYRALVPDLVWSIAPKMDMYDRTELSAILPIMINTLRDGLAMIAWSPDQQREILDWLFEAHGRALRAEVNLDVFQVPSLPVMQTNFEPLVENVTIKATAPTSGELHAAERILTATAALNANPAIQTIHQYAEHEVLASLNLDDIDGVSFDEIDVMLDEHDGERVRERLYNGVNISINLVAKPTRAKLSWISEDADNLLLTLEGQKLPMVMSLRVFKRLYNHGRVHFLEAELLFERAVKSLLDSAEQMDELEAV